MNTTNSVIPIPHSSTLIDNGRVPIKANQPNDLAIFTASCDHATSPSGDAEKKAIMESVRREGDGVMR